MCLARCYPNLDRVIFGGTISWMVANWLVWLYRKGKFPLHMSFRESMYHIYIYYTIFQIPTSVGPCFRGVRPHIDTCKRSIQKFKGTISLVFAYENTYCEYVTFQSNWCIIKHDHHIKIYKIVTHNAAILQSSI